MKDDGGGNAGDDGPATTQSHFCYQCNRSVSITPTPNCLFCPNCKSSFIVEHQNPNPNSDLQNPFLAFDDSSLFSFVSNAVSGNCRVVNYKMALSPLFNSPMSRPGAVKVGEFDPYLFLENHVKNLAERGADTELVENSDGLFLVNVSKSAVKYAVQNLLNFKIREQDLDSDCAVCTCAFQLDEEVIQFPCNHLYHSECILPWLELNNSCPFCRHELPTDNEDLLVSFAVVDDTLSADNTSVETSNRGTRNNNSSGDGNQENGGQDIA